MTIDDLLAEKYDRKSNNCLHFAGRAWHILAGDDRLYQARESDIPALRGLMRQFKRVNAPTVEPSIALMDNVNGEEHIGVCVRRRILHLAQHGAEFMPVDSMLSRYSHMRFFVP